MHRAAARSCWHQTNYRNLVQSKLFCGKHPELRCLKCHLSPGARTAAAAALTAAAALARPAAPGTGPEGKGGVHLRLTTSTAGFATTLMSSSRCGCRGRRRSVSPGAAAATGVGASTLGSGSVLDKADLSTVDLGAVQLLQGPLHVRVQPELDHTLILPALVGVGIGHLPCLPHVVLENRNM